MSLPKQHEKLSLLGGQRRHITLVPTVWGEVSVFSFGMAVLLMKASGWHLGVEMGGAFPLATCPVQAQWCSHRDSFTPIAPGPLFSLFLQQTWKF